MWKDDYKLQKIFNDFPKVEKFPCLCPICEKKDTHVYMQKYNQKTLRGGLWVWCSQCNSFSHSSIYVPAYWVNYPNLVLENLSAIPMYLDNMKVEIDRHVNYILKNIENGKEL